MEKLTIHSVPVSLLLECLADIQLSGVEYIDIIGTRISEYMDKLEIMIPTHPPDVPPEGKISINFEGEEVNDLI